MPFYTVTRKGMEVVIKQILSGVRLRDERCVNCEVAPLRLAQDTLVIEGTNMSIGQVLEAVMIKLQRNHPV